MNDRLRQSDTLVLDLARYGLHVELLSKHVVEASAESRHHLSCSHVLVKASN